ncbi:tetratricopeptide repeat protein [Salibacterium aidingense]|uniref:tetratricopeptide repeat protein n=1 Tax=Salibacterium aidingense TaxID=384933 RepID=UPI0003F86F47|nr:DUF3196 family protein [Salibacterium aidingense]
MNEEQKQNNIVPFPGSADKLSKEGLDELKGGDKEKASELFSEALKHDPEHEEASYGLLLAYAETGQLKKGSQWAEKMMEWDYGNYFDVLQVYVSLLAQIGEYEKVVTVLEGIQEEERFPARMAEQLFELLELSRNMADSHTVDMEDDKLPAPLNDVNWEEELKTGSGEHKLTLLGEMKNYPPENVLPAIRLLLTDEDCTPLLKSLLLLLLKDLNIEESVWVKKVNRKGEFSPASLCPIEESTAYINISQLMEQVLAHEDPILLEHAQELLREILLFYYPFPPSVHLEALAAVLHAEASAQSGREGDPLFFCRLHNIEESTFCEVKEQYDTLKNKLSEL